MRGNSTGAGGVSAQTGDVGAVDVCVSTVVVLAVGELANCVELVESVGVGAIRGGGGTGVVSPVGVAGDASGLQGLFGGVVVAELDGLGDLDAAVVCDVRMPDVRGRRKFGI